jgi:four helix bundle protein
MSDTRSTQPTGAPAPGPVLDAERLDVYHVALELQVVAAAVTLQVDAVLRDQLRRASLSVPLNIAEGAGQRSKAQKRRFYAIARGSATECAAIFDVLCLRRLAPPSECHHARSLVVRLVQMLTKLDRAIA